MTIRHDMLTAAARAKRLLNNSAADVVAFVAGRMNPDGGFRGRAGLSDLYYTVFGIESLLALGARTDLTSTADYLTGLDDSQLDLVHLACLARCRATLIETGIDLSPHGESIAARLESFRSLDNGYANVRGAQRGTAYGCFLALAAHQDIQLRLPDTPALVQCLHSLRRPDSGYANDHSIDAASTPATAAAVVALHYLGQPVSHLSAQWLLARSRATGGFLATPNAPIPDLLSTATAIHALALTGADIDPIRRPALEFVDSLWSTEGAFAGNWLDDTLDCEYAYYALLAIGHLSTD